MLTLTSLINRHACLFFSRKKSILPADFPILQDPQDRKISMCGYLLLRVDFTSYLFIQAYLFIREVRVVINIKITTYLFQFSYMY